MKLNKIQNKSTQLAHMKCKILMKFIYNKNQLTNCFTAATMFLALMPNKSNNTFGGPERGMPVTASFLILKFFSSATADNTASPKPPFMKQKINVQ